MRHTLPGQAIGLSRWWRRSALAAGALLSFLVSPSGAEYPRLHVRYAEVTAEGLGDLLEQLRQAAAARHLPAMRAFVGREFFWEQDFGGAYNRNDSPLTNLVAALSLDDQQLSPDYRGFGWARLAKIVQSATTMAHPKRKGVVCTPGRPAHEDAKLVRQAQRALRTDPGDVTAWGFIPDREVPVRAEMKADAPAVAVLRSEAVRVHEWSRDWAHVELPNGRRGFVLSGDVQSASPERLCFQRDKNGTWKVVGYMGGGD